MDLHNIVARLHKGGFSIREAAEIVLWMAELGKYERTAGLVYLEQYYQEARHIGLNTGRQYRDVRV